MLAKSPTAIDVHVGSRVRMRRLMIGVSQELLASRLGITFQQVQKYEKGVNRIGASRLQAIAQILNVPISFFFGQDDENPLSLTGVAQPLDTDFISTFLGTREGIALNKAFLKIKNAKTRKSIVALTKVLAGANVETVLDIPDDGAIDGTYLS